jgi:hypothetical protein
VYGLRSNKVEVPLDENEMQFEPFTHRVAQEIIAEDLKYVFSSPASNGRHERTEIQRLH